MDKSINIFLSAIFSFGIYINSSSCYSSTNSPNSDSIESLTQSIGRLTVMSNSANNNTLRSEVLLDPFVFNRVKFFVMNREDILSLRTTNKQLASSIDKNLEQDKILVKLPYNGKVLKIYNWNCDPLFTVEYLRELSEKKGYPLFSPKYDKQTFTIGSKQVLAFSKSESIHLYQTYDNFFRIREWDGKGIFSCYFDPSMITAQSEPYPTYAYKPDKEYFTQESVSIILQDLNIADNVSFDMGCYNRHGVGIFGIDKGPESGYAFYWANPEEKKFSRIKCNSISRYRDGGSSYAVAQNGTVSFSYNISSNSYLLNNEKAEEINSDILDKLSKSLTAAKD